MSQDYLIYQKSLTRTVLNILIVFSVLTGLYYFLIIDYPFFGYNFTFVAPLILIIPRVLYTKINIFKTQPLSFIKFLETLFILGFIISALGSLWLYRVDIYWDWLVHFFNGGFLSAVFSLLFLIFKKNSSRLSTSLFGFILMIPLSILWEFYEFFGDKIFGSKMFGDWFRPLFFDTIFDILLTILGAFLASLLIFHYWRSFLKFKNSKF